MLNPSVAFWLSKIYPDNLGINNHNVSVELSRKLGQSSLGDINFKAWGSLKAT